VEWDFSRQLAQRRLEQERGSREAAEELSEGERPDAAETTEQEPSNRVPRINSEVRIVSDEEDEDRNLYIVLVRYVLLCYA
jgi:sucrose-phosphate synthase